MTIAVDLGRKANKQTNKLSKRFVPTCSPAQTGYDIQVLQLASLL